MSPPSGSSEPPGPSLDEVFRALADPSRRQLLDQLNVQTGQTLRELCAGLAMARQSVSKHLAVLEAADLVIAVRRGREKLHYLNAAPIHEIAERWINHYDQSRVHALADLKKALEDQPMSRPAFVYRTYIHTTPEKLWQALTEPAFTQRYWDISFDSTWEAGAAMDWLHHGVLIVDPEQKVLEYDPYRRLAYTWHTFSPELAEIHGFEAELQTRLAAESRSTVTFELEPVDAVVKLTVIHDGFDDDSATAGLISEGWPQVISNLKTLLETGETLPR
jgi:uncharacterized protein YndB with AHSA1/START domain/DNA-binding transcriptional ArsR family regulator